MILSTKGRYGLRMMFVLARNYGKGPVSLSYISRQEDISVNYLEQLILPLRRKDLVLSKRGAKGGYLLKKAPADITIGAILKTLEGPILAAECLNNDELDCDYVENCVTRKIWQRITLAVDEVIESMTLQDMLDEDKSANLNKVRCCDIKERERC